MNWPALLPVFIKHWPLINAIIQRDGPEVQALIHDISVALQQSPPAAGPVLSGPNFKFPPQGGFTS